MWTEIHQNFYCALLQVTVGYKLLADDAWYDKKYFDSYNKFFIHGDDTIVRDKNIRVYNKIGQAYGTSIDNAYIKNYQDDVSNFYFFHYRE